MKNFFSNFKYKLANWLTGRYMRIDELNWCLFILTILSNWLFNFNPVVKLIIYLVCLILLYWRLFSKNYNLQLKLNKPFNAMFLFIKRNVINPIIRLFKVWYRDLKDIKKYRYRKCPGCGKTLRFKVYRGIKTIDCPVCKKRFKRLIL